MGSAGAVVASRLSENPEWNILLLEAGGDENFFTEVPLMSAFLTSTGFNWGYKSEQMKNACLGLVDGRCNTPRGKALGGSSVINFLLYTRGNRLDYERWQEDGNPGWNYSSALKYFRKSEDCSRCSSVDPEYHGFEGPLKIEHPHVQSPLLKRFLKAGMEMGYKNQDPNGRSQLGFSEVQATMANGRRCSSNKAFLATTQLRPNLQVVTRARVTKILIDPQLKAATGVEFVKNRSTFTVHAIREVVLSAGAINSPQLLMLSGVGPQDHLESLGIPVLQDLKVGYNLQDHLALPHLVYLVNQTITISDTDVQNPVDILNYLTRGVGPYTIPGGALGLAFLKTPKAPKVEDYPDIELVLAAGALNGDVFGTMRGLLGVTEEFDRVVYAPIRRRPAFGISVVQVKPYSRGRVMLKDSNPFHWPLIMPNYFDDPRDLETMVEGIKMAIAVSKTTPFREVNTTLYDAPFPDCTNHHFATDDYWRCVLRNYATTLGHHTGTCKMGPEGDPDAVVDARLKVRGVRNLRVVDVSVMPNIIAGHTNSVAMMIGEKGADLIKEDWRY